jgi:hypothetical protein
MIITSPLRLVTAATAGKPRLVRGVTNLLKIREQS